MKRKTERKFSRFYSLWLNDTRIPRRTYNDCSRAVTAALSLLHLSPVGSVVSIYNGYSVLQFEAKKTTKRNIHIFKDYTS